MENPEIPENMDLDATAIVMPATDASASDDGLGPPSADEAYRLTLQFFRAWLPEAQRWQRRPSAAMDTRLAEAQTLIAWAVGFGTQQPATAAEARFWKKVVKDAAGGDCWLWIGAYSQGHDEGQPTFRWQKVRRPAVLRAWNLIRGALPEGARLHRRCPERRCINPWHYRATLGGQLVADEDITHWRDLIPPTNVGAALSDYLVPPATLGELVAVCPRGHLLPPLRPDGRRPQCPTCQRRAREARERGYSRGREAGAQLAGALNPRPFYGPPEGNR